MPPNDCLPKAMKHPIRSFHFFIFFLCCAELMLGVLKLNPFYTDAAKCIYTNLQKYQFL